MQIYQEMRVASIASAVVARAILFLDCGVDTDHKQETSLLAIARPFGNVVAQFIGRLRLMNQVTTELGLRTCQNAQNERKTRHSQLQEGRMTCDDMVTILIIGVLRLGIVYRLVFMIGT
jgi:hypothetical protein